jgi:hypothetical protein
MRHTLFGGTAIEAEGWCKEAQLSKPRLPVTTQKHIPLFLTIETEQ